MKKFVFVNESGEPAHIIEPALDDAIVDGQTAGEHLVVEIPFDSDSNEYLTTKVYDKQSKSWVDREPKPSKWHKWNNGWELDKESLHGYIRKMRNSFLSKTDWTQSPDSPLSQDKKSEWKQYRQELRDLPLENVTSLEDVVWPTPPA